MDAKQGKKGVLKATREGKQIVLRVEGGHMEVRMDAEAAKGLRNNLQILIEEME